MLNNRYIIFCIFIVLSFWGYAQCPSSSILFREDFGGNDPSDPVAKKTGIASVFGLSYNENPCDYSGQGRYAIRKVGYQPHYEWYTPDDHTYPNDKTRGYFMQVDASKNPCTFYKTQIDNLCESTRLYLSMWAMSSTQLPNYENAYLKLVVEDLDGNMLSSKDIVVENCKGYWEQFGLYFEVPAGQSSIVYKIVNNTATSDGNDFCMDDIEIRLCSPLPVIIPSSNPVCLDKREILSVSFDNDGSWVEPLSYTWFRSNVNSYDASYWEKLGTSEKLIIPNVSESDAVYYRVMVSGYGASEDLNHCSPISDIFKLDAIVCENICEDVSVSLVDTFCLGESYRKNGFDLEPLHSGIVLDTLYLESNGCDSLVYGKFVCLPYEKDTINWRMCQSESYGDGNFSIPVDYKVGNYSFLIEGRDKERCFSHSLNLQVDSVYHSLYCDTICRGEMFVNYGFSVSESGVYVRELKSQTGCDSIVELHLRVMTNYYNEIVETIKDGESYFFSGKSLVESGVYKDSSLTSWGCDSVTVLNLNVERIWLPIVPSEYFTPNSDGLCDVWQILNIEHYPKACVKIYNRFGKLLFEKVNYTNIDGWNGMYHGVPMPSTDYWYVINEPEQDRQYAGHFTLIR